jgi:hypothetical protein
MGITDGWELVVYTRDAYIQARGSWAVELIAEGMVAAGSLMPAGMPTMGVFPAPHEGSTRVPGEGCCVWRDASEPVAGAA